VIRESMVVQNWYSPTFYLGPGFPGTNDDY